MNIKFRDGIFYDEYDNILDLSDPNFLEKYVYPELGYVLNELGKGYEVNLRVMFKIESTKKTESFKRRNTKNIKESHYNNKKICIMKLKIRESNEDFEVVKRFQVSYIEGEDPYDDSAKIYNDEGGFEIVKDPETGLYGWQSDAMDESSDITFNSFNDAYNDAVEAHNSDNGILMIDGEVVGNFDEVDDSNDFDDIDYLASVAKSKAMHYHDEDVSPEGVFLYDGKKRTDYIKYDIVKLIIKPGIEEIDEGPFNKLHRLEFVEIPKTVKRIHSYAFFDCPNLKSLIIPNSVTRIDSCVFVKCPNLKKVVIPKSVTHLGSDIFYGNDQDITVYTDSKYVKDYCLEQEENITVKPLH